MSIYIDGKKAVPCKVTKEGKRKLVLKVSRPKVELKPPRKRNVAKKIKFYTDTLSEVHKYYMCATGSGTGYCFCTCRQCFLQRVTRDGDLVGMCICSYCPDNKRDVMTGGFSLNGHGG